MGVFHTPTPGEKKHRWYHGLDWKLVAAITALFLVVALVWGLVHELEKNDDLVEQAKTNSETTQTLSRQVARLTNRLREVNDAARQDRRQAARERRRLLDQQQRMIDILRDADIITADSAPGDLIVLNPNPDSSQGPPGDRGRPGRPGRPGNPGNPGEPPGDPEGPLPDPPDVPGLCDIAPILC